MTPGDREWLIVDRANQPRGPYTTWEVCTLARVRGFFICKPGMKDWVMACAAAAEGVFSAF